MSGYLETLRQQGIAKELAFPVGRISGTDGADAA